MKRLKVPRYNDVFLDKHVESFMSTTATTMKSVCACFQTTNVELKSCSHINLPPLMPDEDNNFGGSLVLDFRKGWLHMQPKNILCPGPGSSKPD